MLALLIALFLSVVVACVPRPSLSPTPTPTLAAPTATPTPLVAPQPSPSPTPTPSELLTRVPAPPPLDPPTLAQQLRLKSREPMHRRLEQPWPQDLPLGHRESFWVADVQEPAVYTVQAQLLHISPRAYWYVEEGLDIPVELLRRAASAFEEEVYPTVVATLGTGDRPEGGRITILNARLRGAGGYFSSLDLYPAVAYPQSNQREMLYLDAAHILPGSDTYTSVLAHELQHVLHWWANPHQDTWLNEGLSEVAARLVSPSFRLAGHFFPAPGVSLVHWPLDLQSSAPYYAASFLFADYLAQHYGGYASLKHLVAQPAKGVEAINGYLQSQGYQATFREVFQQWTVANVLNDPDSELYGYEEVRGRVSPARTLERPRTVSGSVPQYAADYSELRLKEGDFLLRFQGETTTPLLPLDPPTGGRCWWSNRGDSISASLTRPLDLSGVEQATLQLRLWYEIEREWDYAYVQVSVNGGATWDILSGQHAIPANPVGLAFGPGYSGESDGWVEDEVDLSAYAGQRLLLRLHYVTDDALNGTGLCLDRIAIPETGFQDDASVDTGWQAEGFVRIVNRVPQEYTVQVIELGETTTVHEVPLGADNSGQWRLEGFGTRLDRAIIVVGALTPFTTQPAAYTLEVAPAP